MIGKRREFQQFRARPGIPDGDVFILCGQHARSVAGHVGGLDSADHRSRCEPRDEPFAMTFLEKAIVFDQFPRIVTGQFDPTVFLFDALLAGSGDAQGEGVRGEV